MPSHPALSEINPAELELELEREEARDRARRGILGFTLYTKTNYRTNWHHRALARKLNGFATGKIKRLMVFMPPRHGKSELVSRRLPAYVLGRNPDTQIIMASHTADLAKKMNRDVQRIIDAPEYRELFPKTRLLPRAKWSKEDGDYVRNSSEFEVVGWQGSYKCAGINGPLSGRGGNILILDDPVKGQEEADSEVEREKLWDWYVNVFSAREESDETGAAAGILVTMTRWHEDDLAGRLLKIAKDDPEADQWETITFPAIKDSVENPDDPRAEGDALWPDKYPIERLNKRKATGGSRKFNALYQQRPSSEEGEILKREWMKKFFLELPKLHNGRWSDIVISSDLRFKEDKNSGDYVVHQGWARLGSQIYFLGERRGRWGFTDSVKEFVKISNRTPIGDFKVSRKLVENKANGPALENVLKAKVGGIILVEPDGGKLARANAVTPLWEAGNVWLPDPSIYPGIADIVEEWASFGPGCAFDDRVDTMSQALNRFQNDIDNGLEDLTRW